MGYEAREIVFFQPVKSTRQIKQAMTKFFETWLPMHSSSEDLDLYHYTTLEGLKGIINSRSIWFTHTSTLNDPLELKYGKQLIVNKLSEKIKDVNDTNIEILLQSMSRDLNAIDIIKYQTSRLWGNYMVFLGHDYFIIPNDMQK